jgi:transposase
MPHLHKKIKKGRPYYYIREIARINGKPTVVSQVYLGSLERILEMAAASKKKEYAKIQPQEYGDLWLANLVDRDIDLASLVDGVVLKGKDETGPSVGEYFLYAVFSRMIDSCSKRALSGRFRDGSIQEIRPVAVEELTSQRYWDKLDRVEEKDMVEIARRFFLRLAELEPPSPDCFLFDITNYYTFMARGTQSELCLKENEKKGRHGLRQVGVALLVSRDNQLPFFYRECEGNGHDSKLFERIFEDVFRSIKRFAVTPERVTIVFDNGMNSDDNVAAIDAREDINFITCYSPNYVPELIHVKTSKFFTVDTVKNKEMKMDGSEEDLLAAFRTTGEFWGKERTVVVTYNPKTARKQRCDFAKRLFTLEETLYSMRDKIRKMHPQWKDPEKVKERYVEICEELHLPKDLYNLDLEVDNAKLVMRFRKSYYRIDRHCDKFGKNIIITDNMDWNTEQIIQASLDRYTAEKEFRNSRDDALGGIMPGRHWTDSKIKCHILTSVVALAYLRLVELGLKRAGHPMSATKAMENMHGLHSCQLWSGGKGKMVRMIDEPTQIQAQIIKAFGHTVTQGGILQRIEG